MCRCIYQPDLVYFQQPVGRPFITFGMSCAVGAWLNHDFDWHDHHLITWQHDHPRPADWWHHRPGERPRLEVEHTSVWQPRNRPALTTRAIDRGWDTHPTINRGWETPTAHNNVVVGGGQPRPGETRFHAPRDNNVVVGGGQPKPGETRFHATRDNNVVVGGGQPRPGEMRLNAPRDNNVAVGGGQPRPGERHETPPPVGRPEPVVQHTVVQHPAETPHASPANGAFIGVQSSRETRQFSSRGQESRQAAAPSSHMSAPTHSTAPSHSSGGGKH